MMEAGCPLAPLPLFKVKVMSWMGCEICICTKLYTYLQPSLVAMSLQAPENHELSLLRDGYGHVTQVNKCKAKTVIQAKTQISKCHVQAPLANGDLMICPMALVVKITTKP